MNGTPIGYHVKIRRKWPRKILAVMIITILGFSVYFVITDFNTIKEFILSFNKQADTIPELISFVNYSQEEKEDKTDFKNTQTTEKLEDIKSDPIVLNPVTEPYQTNKNNQLKHSESETDENVEIVNLTQSNIFEENEHKVTTLSKEKIEPAAKDTNLLNVSEDIVKDELKPEQNTSEIVKEAYYVIVGSVASKEAAEEQQKKFLSMSEKTDVIYESTNKRFRISLGCYSGFKEASAKSKSFQAKHPSYKTWIWKMVPSSDE